MSCLSIVNLSSLVTDAQARLMVGCLNAQLARDVAPAWRILPPRVLFVPGAVARARLDPRAGASLTAAGHAALLERHTKLVKGGLSTRARKLADARLAQAQAAGPGRELGAWIALVDDDSNLQGALGAHWETGEGAPVGEVLCKIILDSPNSGGAGGDVLTGPASVLSVVSHETIELTIDPTVNMWCDAPDGFSYRREPADPVESRVYSQPGSVFTLSNFVTPPWFDETPAPGSKTDFLNVLGGRSFALDVGGYADRRAATRDENQVFGAREKVYGPEKAKTPEEGGYPEWRARMRAELAGLRYSHAARNRAA